MEIRYRNSLEDLRPDSAGGFFVGWANPPNSTTLLDLLDASSHVWLALDDERLVGYIRAVSDGFFTAFVPELEVLPAYQGLGIGSKLVSNLLTDLAGFYSIDLACDDELVGFYRRFGFLRGNGMTIRNYERQAGS
jgi:ribosomal protein S18 acetylase RimI-like enzyme